MLSHPVDAALAPGTTVADRYEVEKFLGRGGMGEVFLARDRCHDRLVALKMLPERLRGSASLQRHFVREGRLPAAIRHPNICAVYEAGNDAGRPFIAMEYVAGETLHDRIARRHLPLGEVVDLALQLASALEEARRHHIVHRDLKSTNIVVTTGGVAKILDFGLARREDVAEDGTGNERVAPSAPGLLMGTPDYMSPEQALGLRVDHRSDLFALGVLLYELTTGTRPFAASSTLHTLWNVVNRQPAPLFGAASPPAERAFAAIVTTLLQKHSTRRYQTAAELRADLLRVQARKAPREERAVPYLTLLRPLAGVAAGLVVTFAGLVPGTVWLCQAGEAAWLSAEDRRTSVWVGDADGGNMAMVVPGAANADAVSVSNGGRLVYSVARGRGPLSIWTAASGRVPPQIVIPAGSQPAVTPDARTIVFRRGGDAPGLYRVGVDGSRLRRLVAGAVAHPAIAPNGRTVIFERQHDGARALWSIDLDGRALRRITAHAPGSRSLISPDGTRVAFDTDAGVIVCSLPDCAKETLLLIGTPSAWTPDGRALAYAGLPNGANVWVVSVDSGVRRQITHFEDRTVNSVAWSPDGRRLAVSRTLALADLPFTAPPR